MCCTGLGPMQIDAKGGSRVRAISPVSALAGGWVLRICLPHRCAEMSGPNVFLREALAARIASMTGLLKVSFSLRGRRGSVDCATERPKQVIRSWLKGPSR